MFRAICDLCQWSRYNHTIKTEMQSVWTETFASVSVEETSLTGSLMLQEKEHACSSRVPFWKSFQSNSAMAKTRFIVSFRTVGLQKHEKKQPLMSQNSNHTILDTVYAT